MSGRRVGRGVGCTICSAALKLTLHQLYKALDLLFAGKMLGKQICWIHFTAYLTQLNRLVSDLLLDPQTLGVDVSQLPQAPASADPHGHCGVCPDSDP